jgi:urea transport system ATP-binding protein
MLDVTGLTLKYGQSPILHGIDLTARPGQVTAVMGVNGVGKTSLIKAIAGRHPRSGGTVRLNGQDLGRYTAAEAARAGIGLVPQGREIFPLLTVTENLTTGFACLPKDAPRAIPPAIYETFPVLHEMKDRRGGDLSGGQQQQLAIARALIARPKVLLLDEPTEGIQPNIIKMIGEVIRRLRAEGQIAIVLVEQYFDFAWDLADSFVALNRGAVTLRADKGQVSREELLARVSI